MSIYRDNMVRLALSYEGCTAADEERYLDLLGPGEPSGVRHEMLSMSGCALTVRGLWRRLGLEHPRLSSPYRVGHAVEDVVSIARERGAWVEPGMLDLPDVGDVVLVAAPEHVWTVVDADALGYYGIDGGQLVEGHQGIARRAHRLERQGLALMDHAHSVRQVRGWVDCDRLFSFPVVPSER